MVATEVRKNYEAFAGKRSTLISLIDRHLSLLSSLSIETEIEPLQQLKQRVSTDVFKVLIVGEFKRGKSTFINAILGQEILPSAALPCTAVINEVKWGESPRALVHYSVSEDNSEKQVKSILVEAIKEYVVIPKNPSEDYTNPYEKVEIFYPLELCRNGVEVIDSPGLNENHSRTQVTQQYLPIVDAIVVVLTCEALASLTEIGFVELLKSHGHQDIFFVCNRFDQIRKNEKEEIKNYAIKTLAPLTERGEKGIFFISALDALEGRLERDEEKLDKSGVPFFERELGKFLIADRGRLKIIEPAKDIQNSIEKVRCSLPERERQLKLTQDELERCYSEQQEKFDDLEKSRKQIEAGIDQRLEEIKLLMYDEAHKFFKGLPSKIREWVEAYQIKSELSFSELIKNSWKFNVAVEAQVKPIVKELSDHVYLCAEKELMHWKQSHVDPLLAERLEALKQYIDSRSSEFIHQIDDLRSKLSAGSSNGYTQKTIKLTELGFVAKAFGMRTAVVGLSVGAIGFGVLGVVGLGVMVALAGFPVAMVASLSLITTVAVNSLRRISIPDLLNNQNLKGDIKNLIKERAIQEFSLMFEKATSEQSNKISEQVYEQLKTIKETIDVGLAKEIDSIHDQVQSILDEKEQGQEKVDKKIRELATISQELSMLEGELGDLISQPDLL